MEGGMKDKRNGGTKRGRRDRRQRSHKMAVMKDKRKKILNGACDYKNQSHPPVLKCYHTTIHVDIWSPL